MAYYSARLFTIILVDDGKARKKNHYDESIIVFKAKDFEHAFARALELGKKQETVYKNGAGQDVKWALVEIAEVRYIGKKIDGVEVISKMFYDTSKTPIPFNTKFDPTEKNAA